VLAHDPEKCERFSDKIMRKDVERASVSMETDRAPGGIIAALVFSRSNENPRPLSAISQHHAC
jgi:hypothetical protein